MLHYKVIPIFKKFTIFFIIDGSIYYMDVEDLENLSFRSFLNGPIVSLIAAKKKIKIIAFHKNGICFYNFVN